MSGAISRNQHLVSVLENPLRSIPETTLSYSAKLLWENFMKHIILYIVFLTGYIAGCTKISVEGDGIICTGQNVGCRNTDTQPPNPNIRPPNLNHQPQKATSCCTYFGKNCTVSEAPIGATCFCTTQYPFEHQNRGKIGHCPVP